jgi:Stress responsive A/B Barrel Domain
MPKVHHMVLLKFKPGAEERFGPLMTALNGLRQRVAGFAHACLMTFTGAAARDQYLRHPDHEKVKDDFLPLLDDVIAFDFEEP